MATSFSIFGLILPIIMLALVVLFFVSLFLFVRKILRNSDEKVNKLTVIEAKLDYLIHELNKK